MRELMAIGLLAAALAEPPAQVKIHGHRGCRALRPENTMPAFRHALELGVDVLELDMGVTKDNHVLVSHDPHINPKLCRYADGRPLEKPLAIRTLTLAETQQFDCGALSNVDYPKQQPVPGTPPPTLDQVLELAKAHPRVEFNIETKIFPKEPELTPDPATFARLVVDIVRKHKLEKRVIVQSFDPRTLREVRKIAPAIRLAVLSSARDPSDYIALAQEIKAEIVSPEFKKLTAPDVARARKLGMQVIPWTPNEEGDWQRMVELGVDAIITDDPAALAAFLKRGSR
jgi:glycerophosphoryl diester phosphodiesterase